MKNGTHRTSGVRPVTAHVPDDEADRTGLFGEFQAGPQVAGIVCDGHDRHVRFLCQRGARDPVAPRFARGQRREVTEGRNSQTLPPELTLESLCTLRVASLLRSPSM